MHAGQSTGTSPTGNHRIRSPQARAAARSQRAACSLGLSSRVAAKIFDPRHGLAQHAPNPLAVIHCQKKASGNEIFKAQ